MNFTELYKKIQAIEEGTVAECGGMPMPGHAPEQQDTVTMNVSMNGSGAGGIRDLLGVLKNIENGGDGSTDMVVGDSVDNSGDFGNVDSKPNEVTLDIDSVVPTGNDMHSKGGEAEKVNGGGNPMHREVDESLVSKLSAMYEALKGNQKKLDTDADGDIEADDLADLRSKKKEAESK